MQDPRRLAAPASLLLVVACGDAGSADPTATGVTGSPVTVTASGSTTSSGGPTTGASTGTGGTSSGSSGAEDTTDATDTSSGATTGPVTSASTTDDPASSTTGPAPCPEDKIVCAGDVAQVCDGPGGFKGEELCPALCADDVGCVGCDPGDTTCKGDQVVQCNDTGTAFDIVVTTCDGLLGLSCDAQTGGCAGPCANLGLSYIGCDYYPTVLQQNDGFNALPYEFAVAVANTSDQPATITVTRAADMVTQVTVAPASVQIVPLPWIDALTIGKVSSLVTDGAYRLRSTRPVTVYQYNPIGATYSNDASLLLPVNTWTSNYLVASWPHWLDFPGFYAVVAREDGTTVTLTPSTTGKLVAAGGGVASNGAGVITLNADDVLQVQTAPGGDLTGTIVSADKPVQVFGGHECTNIPAEVIACDHLEEAIFPIETLAKEYVVVPPVQVPNDNLAKAQMVRIIASEPSTTFTTTPNVPGGKYLAKAGDFVEVSVTTAKFVVTADKKILVTQYMVGQEGGYGVSDPSMLQAVNPLQWRSDYLVHAPTNWIANYADLIAKTGTIVTVDDEPVLSWTAIGNTGYSFAHVKLSNDGDGNHKIVGNTGVGVAISGVLDAGSYWYPGGLNLDLIPQ